METYFYRAPTMCFIIKGKEAGDLLGLSTQHVSKAGELPRLQVRGWALGRAQGLPRTWQSQELKPRADSPPCLAHNTQLLLLLGRWLPGR